MNLRFFFYGGKWLNIFRPWYRGAHSNLCVLCFDTRRILNLLFYKWEEQTVIHSSFSSACIEHSSMYMEGIILHFELILTNKMREGAVWYQSDFSWNFSNWQSNKNSILWIFPIFSTELYLSWITQYFQFLRNCFLDRIIRNCCILRWSRIHFYSMRATYK